MKVAVVGAGIMGSGIVQVAAMAGHVTMAVEADQGRIDRAKAAIDDSLSRFIKAGKLDRASATKVVERVFYSTDLEKGTSAADVVIEAVPEILELKREVLGHAADFATSGALLATNTSQLSITAIGRDLGTGATRLIGMHFFNPPVMMKLVELVCGLKTSAATLDRARTFCESLGKQVVICRKDSPGFLTSRAYAAFRLECVRMVEEGLAAPEDIDTAFRLGFNFPMGPFELGDFNGIDTFVHVLDSLTLAYGERFRATPMLRNMVAAGRLGRKSGVGFFAYDPEGRRSKS